MLPLLNRFPTALQLLHAAFTCARCETLLNNTFLRTHAPFRSLTFVLNVGIELTANQCQSVGYVPFPLLTLGPGAWSTMWRFLEQDDQNKEPPLDLVPRNPFDWAVREFQSKTLRFPSHRAFSQRQGVSQGLAAYDATARCLQVPRCAASFL